MLNCSCVDCLGVIPIPCCGIITPPTSVNKSYILYNDMTESVIATPGSEQPFTLAKKYTLPFGQLTTDGDQIDITAVFNVCDIRDPYVTIKYDNVALCTWRVPCINPVGTSACTSQIIAHAVINRVLTSTSANNLLCTGVVDYIMVNPSYLITATKLGQGKIYQIISKQYGTSPGLDIECKGYANAFLLSTSAIKCKQLCVKYIGI